MTDSRSRFSVQVDETEAVCPVGETWATEKIRTGAIPIMACEGPCIRGEIARLAANLVAKNEPYARTCYAEVALVPHSAMARWVKSADRIVMIDGCFLNCMGRVLNNLVDEHNIVHIDALKLHGKYSDLFLMDDVPEDERKQTAHEVADKILCLLGGGSADTGAASCAGCG
jgi:uncharacterized metal-binding protein